MRHEARVREGGGAVSVAVPENVCKTKRGLQLVGKQSQMGLAAVSEADPPRGRRANQRCMLLAKRPQRVGDMNGTCAVVPISPVSEAGAGREVLARGIEGRAE